MDKAAIAKEIEAHDRRFHDYIATLNRDKVMETLFPKTWRDLQDPLNKHPTGNILRDCGNPDFVKKLIGFYENYLRELIKDVRDEKHDHHGLHKLLEDLIRLTRSLL